MSLLISGSTSTSGPEQPGGGAAGVDEPEDPIRAATVALLAGIAEARSPLAAERVLCAALGAVGAGLPDASDEQRLEAQAVILDQVIGLAEAHAGVEALGLLRVCSVLGPATCRSAAQKSAGLLAAAGVPDRPWAGRVGSQQMLRAWRDGDFYGAQSSVGVLFDYQGREHAAMVLLDHLLGGGVKDCWVAEGRPATEMRNSVATAMAGEPETFFEDIDAATAADLLAGALACPPCPERADQIEDVNEYLYLVRPRVEHLARLTGTSIDYC